MYFDKNRLGYKSSKNQKYFKNYFVKESFSLSPLITYNFCGRGEHINSTCSLRISSQKTTISKIKKIWIEKSKVTNTQGLKKIWLPKITWVMFVGLK